MIKVALKKVFRYRIFSTHPESSQFHELRRSCERSILFQIENSFGAWVHNVWGRGGAGLVEPLGLACVSITLLSVANSPPMWRNCGT
jgi:hypothetical protein